MLFEIKFEINNRQNKLMRIRYEIFLHFFQASEIEPLNKEEDDDIRDEDSEKITMCQTTEDVV